MSTPLYHKFCAIGKHAITDSSAVVIAIDQSDYPATPPTCIYACKDCRAASGWKHTFIISIGQRLADYLTIPHGA